MCGGCVATRGSEARRYTGGGRPRLLATAIESEKSRGVTLLLMHVIFRLLKIYIHVVQEISARYAHNDFIVMTRRNSYDFILGPFSDHAGAEELRLTADFSRQECELVFTLIPLKTLTNYTINSFFKAI